MSNRRDRLLIGLALILSIASLSLNGFLVWQLSRARNTTRAVVNDAIASLSDLEAGDFRYEYHLKQLVPFRADIPIRQDLNFPIETTVPISTVIHVPLSTPFGSIVLPVPIRTSIPIDMQVPVHLDTSFPVSITVPVDMTIPVAIPLKDTPALGILQRMAERLIQLRDAL